MGCFLIVLLFLIALAFPTLAAVLALVLFVLVVLGGFSEAYEAERQIKRNQ